MCYRFQQNWPSQLSPEERIFLEEWIGKTLGIEEIPPSFTNASNIAFTDPALVVSNEVPRQAEMYKFGLIPYGTPDPKKVTGRYGNARGETAEKTYPFKESILRRRCLIPVSGFYDWVEDPNTKDKTPFCAYVPDQPIFCFAGIYDRWINPNTKEVIKSFSIITLAPNKLWEPIHNRMPVILEKEHYELWIDPADKTAKDLKNVLKIFPAERMAIREFSNKVNNSKNKNEAELIPVGEPVTI